MAKEIVLGVTGASGGLYAARLLRALEDSPDVGLVHLVVSRHGRVSLREELDVPDDGPLDLERLCGVPIHKARLHPPDAVEAVISSGSHPTEGMAVVPCSVGTLARIAHGISDSLLTRAADVCLKERRRLILAVRETPLSLVAIRNLALAAEAGATIMPAVPAFYGRPQSVDDVIDQFLARVLDHLGVAHKLGRRWRPAAER